MSVTGPFQTLVPELFVSAERKLEALFEFITSVTPLPIVTPARSSEVPVPPATVPCARLTVPPVSALLLERRRIVFAVPPVESTFTFPLKPELFALKMNVPPPVTPSAAVPLSAPETVSVLPVAAERLPPPVPMAMARVTPRSTVAPVLMRVAPFEMASVLVAELSPRLFDAPKLSEPAVISSCAVKPVFTPLSVSVAEPSFVMLFPPAIAALIAAFAFAVIVGVPLSVRVPGPAMV